MSEIESLNLNRLNKNPSEASVAIAFAGIQARYDATRGPGFPGNPLEERVHKIMEHLLEKDPFKGPLNAAYTPNPKNGPFNWTR